MRDAGGGSVSELIISTATADLIEDTGESWREGVLSVALKEGDPIPGPCRWLFAAEDMTYEIPLLMKVTPCDPDTGVGPVVEVRPR